MVEKIKDKEVCKTNPLSKQNESKNVYKAISQSETMAEKLSWLSSNYWEVINQESESDYEITEKDIYEAELSDIEKEFDNGSVAYRIFQILRKKGLRIFINQKTDISYTKGYNIIRGRGPVTQQSRETMEIGQEAKDEEVYKTKLTHEMGHSLTSYVPKEMKFLFNLIIQLRQAGMSVTKLGNLDRYKSVSEKATDDVVEFVRMYIQSPEKFKTYLGKTFKSENTQNLLYKHTKDCIDAVLSKKG